MEKTIPSVVGALVSAMTIHESRNWLEQKIPCSVN